MFDEVVSGRRDRHRAGGRFRARPRSVRPEGRSPAPAGELKDLKQKASYSYGYRLGLNLKNQGVEIDAQALARGLADALGGTAAMKDAEMQACLQAFAQQVQSKQAGMASKAAAANKVAG